MNAAVPCRDILIVDDEQHILDLLQLALAREVASMDTAVDCASACVLLAANTYRSMLTDVRLPDGSGLELVKEYIAASTDGCALVMSAYAEQETEQESARLGAKKFYPKPFRNLVGLGSEIHELLCRSQPDRR